MPRALGFAFVLILASCGDYAADDAAASSTGPSPASSAAADTTAPADTTVAKPGTTTGELVGECEGSPHAIADCVEGTRYAAGLEFIADIRVPGNPHWRAVQDLCFDRLTEWGYDVELHDYGSGINVIGRRTGATSPNEVVVIGTHHDHIEDCLGADDNPTGVAAALEIGRVLATPVFDRTVVIACWDEEERGLYGSAAFAAQAADAGTAISSRSLRRPPAVARFHFAPWRDRWHDATHVQSRVAVRDRAGCHGRPPKTGSAPRLPLSNPV